MRDIYDSKDKVSVYCNQRYSTWAQRGISGREHGLLTSLLEELPRAERILDIPVGYGRFTPLLLPHTDCLLSFDLSPRMLVKAAERQQDLVPELAGKIHLAGANIGWLPLADKSVDLSLMVRLLQHLHQREWRVAALRELNRVTRRRVILTFYRSGTFHHAQRLVKKVRPKTKEITFHSINQFMEEAGEAGIEVERIIKLVRMVHSQTFAVLRPS